MGSIQLCLRGHRLLLIVQDLQISAYLRASWEMFHALDGFVYNANGWRCGTLCGVACA
jgi:hypothetical protein